MALVPVPVARADADRVSALAPVFARAFAHEPMMTWSLGAHGDVVQRFESCFAYFLERVLELGLVWEAGAAQGAAVWVPPDQSRGWADHPWSQPRIHALTEDGGRRYEGFWDWVESYGSDDTAWQLDSIAVEPAAQGQGIGRSLIEAGLMRARAGGVGAYLSTGTRRNVDIYERSGFRLIDSCEAPDGGPRVWFMRWDAQQ